MVIYHALVNNNKKSNSSNVHIVMSKLEVEPNKKTFGFYVCRVLHENSRAGLYSGETPRCFRSLTLIMVSTRDGTINFMPIIEWVSNFASLL